MSQCVPLQAGGTRFWGKKHKMVSRQNIIHDGSKSHWHFLPFSLGTSLSNDQTKSPQQLSKDQALSLQVPLHGGIVRSLVPVLQPIQAGVFLIFLEVLTGLFSSSSFFFLLQ